MHTMEIGWTEIIVSAISVLGTSGAFAAVVNRSKHRAARQKQVADEWQELWRNERDSHNETRKRLSYMHNENAELRNKLDIQNSKVSVLQVIKCDKLKCQEREPPFGSSMETSISGEIVFRNYEYPPSRDASKDYDDGYEDIDNEEY